MPSDLLPPPPDAPSDAPGADDLAGLFGDLKAADRAIRSAVLRASALAGSGVCERVAGGPLEWAIGMVCRMTGADRRMIVAAGETLAHLPTVSRLWADEMLSWGQIRSITMAVRRLPIAARAEVDARLAVSAQRYGGIDAFDPDHLVEAVDRAAAELSDPRNAERREQRAAAANFLALQQSFDGGVSGWFDYDPMNAAIVINGLDAASPPPKLTTTTSRASRRPAGANTPKGSSSSRPSTCRQRTAASRGRGTRKGSAGGRTRCSSATCRSPIRPPTTGRPSSSTSADG